MIRVLVVDDSPTARALLCAVLAADPALRVVGEARDGVEGVEMAQRLRPDVITMDIHMPRLDGFAATREIMITAPAPIVIATNSIRAAEVEVAMQALRVGAVAVVRKPHGPAADGFEETSDRLRATVKAMAGVKVVRRWRSDPADRQPDRPANRERRLQTTRAVKAVAIAASTGGPAALQTLLSALPGEFSPPLLIVQHITAGFTEGLAAWLNSVTGLRVKLAEHGERLLQGVVYLAPDGWHLGVSNALTVALDDGPPVGGFRPSATYLFQSAARVFGPSTAAVVLTGMGEDGVAGLAAVRQAGGRILVQDEKSSVVFGMPGAAVAAGLADAVLPPEEIAARLAVMG